MSAIVGLDAAIASYLSTREFRPVELTVDDEDRRLLARMKVNPQRFIPRIFEGDWGDPARHPEVGPARLLRIIEGSDGVVRAIVRQGRSLYAYPFA